ncbi:MmcQ/YjbR family DNA-binding protein [Nocardiopsis sp. HNM0947]|uniref:MmcQ/YjbR family DNA-binding protein n=1 Tax=Nocardiopsis coralli TaxID=2772213 RepID=A0ABR9P1L3_9ACTN|nr:MmcQ/YjbR family DNA-binding protein [Nocardiopsis coralli]MBE2997722.1 MmcQ/YjbR family DNA-binding protein [Nocardiopsis coralli]
MDGTRLQDTARQRALELPGSEQVYPFGPEHEVFKVRGRVFLLMTELEAGPVVTLKAAPIDAEALRESHPGIGPGYHMNKRHWITLYPDVPDAAGADADLVHELVTESYRLVVGKLPRADRPIDPAAFGVRPSR